MSKDAPISCFLDPNQKIVMYPEMNSILAIIITINFLLILFEKSIPVDQFGSLLFAWWYLYMFIYMGIIDIPEQVPLGR